MTKAEAAAYLAMTRQGVDRAIAAGRLIISEPGRRGSASVATRLDRASVERERERRLARVESQSRRLKGLSDV